MLLTVAGDCRSLQERTVRAEPVGRMRLAHHLLDSKARFMFSIRQPSQTVIARLHDRLRNVSLTYRSAYEDSVAARSFDSLAPYRQAPAGFITDHFECELGQGTKTYHAACQAIREWKMFPQKMAEIMPVNVPIEIGQIVSVLFRAGPLWTANSARILHVLELSGPITRFGFTYGTLPGHIARGEETFLVEHNVQSDRVTYSVRAFSRPSHWIAWLGYPYLRYEQARFRRLSAESMRAACGRSESMT